MKPEPTLKVDVPSARQHVKTPKKAAAAAFLGSALEYYDFFIYGSAAALIFGQLFFPAGNPALATVSALATFGAGYLARPLGGVVLGHFGDKIGRKKILLLTLGIMGAASIGIGCLPTYDQIGIWAPILLTLMRLLQGFSAGGESAGASTLVLEHSPEGRRAFFTSFVMTGYAAGMVLATVIFIPIAALPEEDLYSWGWRVPFWLSIVVLLIAYWVRQTLDETPDFEAAKEEHEVKALPLKEVLRYQWKDVLRVFFAMTYAAMGTMYSVFILAYATSEAGGIPRTDMLTVNAVAVGLSIFAIPAAAVLSDRIGRKPILLVGVVGAIATTYLIFWAIGTGNIWLIMLAAFLNTTVFQSFWNGVWPVFFGEMFATPVRYTGFAVGNQFGLLLVGFTPAIASLLVGAGTTNWLPAAIFTTVCLGVSGVAIASARETYKTPAPELGVKYGSHKH